MLNYIKIALLNIFIGTDNYPSLHFGLLNFNFTYYNNLLFVRATWQVAPTFCSSRYSEYKKPPGFSIMLSLLLDSKI